MNVCQFCGATDWTAPHGGGACPLRVREVEARIAVMDAEAAYWVRRTEFVFVEVRSGG